MGPFVEAWVRINSRKKGIKAEAHKRYLTSFHDHLTDAGIGHISEITDAVSPFTPRGCPFQAWSLAELLRLEFQVLTEK